MDPQFWHDRWRNGEIGFHQPDYHPALLRHWPGLGLPAGTRVFVPLCGRSLDMAWLASRGHAIVGIELSPIAVAEFFTHLGLTALREPAGALERWRGGPYELLCGDFFELSREQVGEVAGWFDRAALVALPPALRQRYARHLAGLLPPAARGLLIGLDYEQSRMDGPPFSVPPAEVEALLAERFTLQTLERLDCLPDNPRFRQRGLDAIFETAYRLQRR